MVRDQPAASLPRPLSADAACKVLILEAGPMDRSLFIHMLSRGLIAFSEIPRLTGIILLQMKTGFGVGRFTPQGGRVVGGSSSINSMVYMRGHRLDYDGWAYDFNLPEWGFTKCLPYFIAGER